MRSERVRRIVALVAACAACAAGCGGSPRILRDESVPIERRIESEDRTVAKVDVLDGAVVVAVERQLVCQRGTYDERVVEEPAHGSGWIWGGAGALVGGVAVANDKNGAAPGVAAAVTGVVLVIVGAAKLGAGPKKVETKGEPSYGASQVCATRPVIGAFVSVTVGAESLAVQSTGETGTATLHLDDASWARAPLTVHVDIAHEKTVVVDVTRDGSVETPAVPDGDPVEPAPSEEPEMPPEPKESY